MDNNYHIVQAPAHVIREIARNKLKGHWKEFTLVTAVMQIIVFLIPELIDLISGGKAVKDMLIGDMGVGESSSNFPAFSRGGSVGGAFSGDMSVISSVYLLLIAGAIAVGISYFTLKFLKDRDTNLENLFKGFNCYGKSTGLYFLTSIIMAIPIVILGIFAGVFVLSIFTGGGAGTSTFAAFMTIAVFFAFAYIFYVGLGLQLAPYFIADYDMGVIDSIKNCWKSMKGNRVNLFVLQLTFLGWAFLAAIPFGILSVVTVNSEPNLLLSLIMFIGMIPLFFTMSYVQVAEGVFYKMVVGKILPADKLAEMEHACEDDSSDINSILDRMETEESIESLSDEAKGEDGTKVEIDLDEKEVLGELEIDPEEKINNEE